MANETNSERSHSPNRYGAAQKRTDEKLSRAVENFLRHDHRALTEIYRTGLTSAEKTQAREIGNVYRVSGERVIAAIWNMVRNEVAQANPSKMQTLLQIAQRHAGVETLDERKSDGLDFYDLPVWTLRDMLDAAFEAGRAAEKAVRS